MHDLFIEITLKILSRPITFESRLSRVKGTAGLPYKPDKNWLLHLHSPQYSRYCTKIKDLLKEVAILISFQHSLIR